MVSVADVGDVYGSAEGVEHPHLLQDVFTTCGADDEQLTALHTLFTYTRYTQPIHTYTH